jgi:hypothetical protein
MSLKAELDAFRSEFMAQVPLEVRDAALQSLSNKQRGVLHANTSR